MFSLRKKVWLMFVFVMLSQVLSNILFCELRVFLSNLLDMTLPFFGFVCLTTFSYSHCSFAKTIHVFSCFFMFWTRWFWFGRVAQHFHVLFWRCFKKYTSPCFRFTEIYCHSHDCHSNDIEMIVTPLVVTAVIVDCHSNDFRGSDCHTVGSQSNDWHSIIVTAMIVTQLLVRTIIVTTMIVVAMAGTGMIVTPVAFTAMTVTAANVTAMIVAAMVVAASQQWLQQQWLSHH